MKRSLGTPLGRAAVCVFTRETATQGSGRRGRCAVPPGFPFGLVCAPHLRTGLSLLGCGWCHGPALLPQLEPWRLQGGGEPGLLLGEALPSSSLGRAKLTRHGCLGRHITSGLADADEKGLLSLQSPYLLARAWARALGHGLWGLRSPRWLKLLDSHLTELGWRRLLQPLWLPWPPWPLWLLWLLLQVQNERATRQLQLQHSGRAV